jgi:hypothetical protein
VSYVAFDPILHIDSQQACHGTRKSFINSLGRPNREIKPRNYVVGTFELRASS